MLRFLSLNLTVMPEIICSSLVELILLSFKYLKTNMCLLFGVENEELHIHIYDEGKTFNEYFIQTI